MTNCSCGLSPGHRALQIFSTLTGILQIKVSESESSWANALVCHRNCDQHLQTASPLRGEHSWDWPILPFCGNLVSCGFEWGISGSHWINVRTTLHQQHGGDTLLHGPRADLTVWQLWASFSIPVKSSVQIHTMDPNSAEHWAHAPVPVPVP